MRPLRVLVAESNATFCETLLHVLAIVGGCQVLAVVADGEAAVQAALSLSPDLALVDAGLQGRNGVEVARHWRQLLPELRVVLLLSYDHSTYQTAAAECGAAWVAKDRLAETLGPMLEEIRTRSTPAG